jgi:Flp pilus assembly protein TadB
MGIKDMADEQGKRDISEESGRRWNQFLMLEVAVLFAFIIAFVPMLGFIYIIAILIASIVLAVVLMGFMSRCGDSLL